MKKISSVLCFLQGHGMVGSMRIRVNAHLGGLRAGMEDGLHVIDAGGHEMPTCSHDF